MSTRWIAGAVRLRLYGYLPACFAMAALLLGSAARAETPAVLATVSPDELRRIDLVNRLPFGGTFKKKMCVNPKPTAEAAIDVHRSLFVHDRATLDARNFSLTRTFGQLAAQASALTPGLDAVAMFRQFWDTQNAPPGATSGLHCTNPFNGYPYQCPRGEGAQANGTDVQVQTQMDKYRVLALVNRIDLAHEGWRNCGEYRIIYGLNPLVAPSGEVDFGRNFIIFEAVLPNPKPGCRSGCVEVAKFWKSLSAIDDPAERGRLLEDFFYGPKSGTPEVLPDHARVVNINHYSVQGGSGTGYTSAGSGQIRTNQFLVNEWLLREFKTVVDCGRRPLRPCSFNFVPVPVKVSPFGRLWNEDLANTGGPFQTRAQNFQNDVLTHASQLASTELMQIGYSVQLPHDSGDSVSQAFDNIPEQYLNRFNDATGAVNSFRTGLAAAATGHGLTASQLVNRALSQSCAGCHQPAGYGLMAVNAIGPAVIPGGTVVNRWPAASFSHIGQLVDGSLFPANPVFGSGAGHALSAALNDVFLPARKEFLLEQLNGPECLCVKRFAIFPEHLRVRAERLQDEVDQKFEPRIADISLRLSQALQAGKPESSLREERQALAKLHAERDQELVAQLRKIGLTLPALKKPGVESLQLTARKVAGDTPKDEGEWIRQRTLQLLEQEPPRRTVTGMFSPH